MTSIFVLMLLSGIILTAVIVNICHSRGNKNYSEYLNETYTNKPALRPTFSKTKFTI